jgi:3-hydroxybutyryl-CoA dehydratase
MNNLPIRPGDRVEVEKTIGESDVYLFAGITGDLNENHVNEQHMQTTRYGGRLAHGALILGFTSTASSKMIEFAKTRGQGFTPVALGYDSVRFVGPVFIGDTIKVEYEIEQVDVERLRSVASTKITARNGELVLVGKHLLKWLRAEPNEAKA